MTTIATENKPTLYERYLAIIKSYLTQPNTDSALLINGEWGSGKTFFVRHDLCNMIEGEPKDGGLELKVFYISLFGVQSIEGLKNKIFSQLMIASETDKAISKKIGGGFWQLAKDTVTKTIDKFSEKLTGEKLTAMIRESAIEDIFSDTKNIIIFDDLERCDAKLNEILGYINEQVEHKGIKTILIADESKISDTNFRVKKEKLISRTIKFETDLTLLYDKIIETYKESKDYFNFLQKQKETIVTMCKEFELRNLRTFSFALGILKEVYEAGKDIENYPQESTDTIILFVLSISIEFKSGHISNTDKKYFSNEMIKINPSDLIRKTKMFTQDKKDNIETEQTKEKKYRGKYLSNRKYKYHYFDSIFNFIVNGYFDKNKYLTGELMTFLPMEKSEQDKIHYYFLNIRNLYEINDVNFNENMNIFLRHIEEGSYIYYEYYHILLSLIRFDFIMLDYDFYEKTKFGFEKSKNKLFSFFNKDDFQKIENLHDRLKNIDNVEDIRLENMYNMIKEHHFKTIENNNKEISVNILKILKDRTHFNNFSNYVAEFGIGFNVLSMVDSNDLINLLQEIDNKKTGDFFLSLRDRQPSNGKYIHYAHIYNLLLLRKNLKEYLNSLDTNMPIRKYNISSIAIPIIDNIIKKKDTELYSKLLNYSAQFRQTFSHLQAKNLHLQASYALDTEWFAVEYRFVEQPTSEEFNAIEIDLDAILTEENTTKEAFLQEMQQDKKIIFYDTETLYIFASPTLERWTPEHAIQDARDVLGIMSGSLPNYPQTA